MVFTNTVSTLYDFTMEKTVAAEAPQSGADRRNALVASARKHFVQKGFEATSLDDLIADAGGSRRNIYGLFGGKEGILRAVIEEIVAEIAQTAEMPDASGDDPRAWLIEVGTAFAKLMLSADIVAVFRQFIATGGSEAAVAEQLWQAGPDRFRRALADWLRVQNETGRLNVKDPDFASIMLPEMFRGSFQIEILIGRRTHVSEEEIRAQVEAATDLFLAASAPADR